jgi:hypothetical protein
VLDEPITDAPSQYASEFGKECLQNAIYLGCKATESILTDVDCDAEHRMRVPISVHEDANARRSTTLLHDLPVARYNWNIVGVDLLAVAGLVVADEEGDVLLWCVSREHDLAQLCMSKKQTCVSWEHTAQDKSHALFTHSRSTIVGEALIAIRIKQVEHTLLERIRWGLCDCGSLTLWRRLIEVRR